MTRNNIPCIALILLACLIIAVVPATALQSAEQSVGGSLTRGSRFMISITGLPNTPYYIWLTGTSTMTGEQYDQPPVIAGGQAVIETDPEGGPYTIGSYRYNNGGGLTILDDIAPSTATMSNTNYYAQVTTDETGQAVVEFQTSVNTGLRSYSVKVENPHAPESENFRVEEKGYSRGGASRPMVNTPIPTVTIPVLATTLPTTISTPAPTLPVVTSIPATTPQPAKKTPAAAGIAAVAAGIGILARGRWELT